MQRRLLLAASASALLLGACGFQLRSAPELAFQSLYMGASNSALANELRRNLASLGSLQVRPTEYSCGRLSVLITSASIRGPV